MQLCTVVKLITTPEQHAALLQTLRTCNAACERISRLAFAKGVFRKYSFQKLCYHDDKAATQLHANHVVRAVAKVADAYKLDTNTLRAFAPLGGVELDARVLSWDVEAQVCDIATMQGRLKIPFVCSAMQKELLRGKRG